MKPQDIKEINEWLENPDRDLAKGRELGDKHIKNRILLKTINRSDKNAARLLPYHLERAIKIFEMARAKKADNEYKKQQAKKQANPAKPNQSSSKKQAEEKQPAKQNADALSFEKGLPEELTPEVVEELKKRAGKLRHEAAIAHADMKKAKTDKERFELAAVVVARDAESRAIWNRLENKGKVEKMPDRELSDTEKLAKILSGGGIKTIKDSLKRAKKKLREAETDKAKKLAQRSVDKYTEQIAEFNRLMGADNGRQ